MMDELLANMQMLWDNNQARHDEAAQIVQWANGQLDKMDVDLVMSLMYLSYSQAQIRPLFISK